MTLLNKNRYFELTAKDKNLELKSTSLYEENRSEHYELRSYQIILEERVYYENRFQYIDLIQKYIDGRINCYRLQWDFFDLYYDHMKISDKLIENLNQSGISSNISFEKDSKIENFSLLLEDMVPLCDALDDVVTEDMFDLEIKKIYSNMQKYAESTSVISDDRQVLRNAMIFLSIISFLSYSFLKPELFNLFSNIFS